MRPLLDKVLDELSEEDRKVASLLSDGLTEDEIRIELYLTEDAAHRRVAKVKSKVSAELAKRGITSTKEAWTWLDEGGIS